MFDIGFWELSVIAMIALVVLGPERMPKFAAKIGYWVGTFRFHAQRLRQEIQNEVGSQELRQALHEQEQELHNLKIMMQEAQAKKENQDSKKTKEGGSYKMEPIDNSGFSEAPIVEEDDYIVRATDSPNRKEKNHGEK